MKKSAYRIKLKLLPAEPHCTFEYVVLAASTQAALTKVFRQMAKDTSEYDKGNTMEIQSVELLDATVVL